MMRRTLAAGLGLAVAACGGNTKPQVTATLPAPAPVVAAAPQAPAPPKAVLDPVAALIATSQKHFDAGEKELAAGHLEKARLEFDRAVEVLLESPYGARTDARMRDHLGQVLLRVADDVVLERRLLAQ